MFAVQKSGDFPLLALLTTSYNLAWCRMVCGDVASCKLILERAFSAYIRSDAENSCNESGRKRKRREKATESEQESEMDIFGSPDKAEGDFCSDIGNSQEELEIQGLSATATAALHKVGRGNKLETILSRMMVLSCVSLLVSGSGRACADLLSRIDLTEFSRVRRILCNLVTIQTGETAMSNGEEEIEVDQMESLFPRAAGLKIVTDSFLQYRSGNFREAELLGITASSMLPYFKRPDALCTVACALSAQGKHWAALSQLKSALKIEQDPTLRTQIMQNIARLYRLLGKADAEAGVLNCVIQSGASLGSSLQRVPVRYQIGSQELVARCSS